MAWASDLSGLMAGAQAIPQVDIPQIMQAGSTAMSGINQGIKNRQEDWQNQRTRNFAALLSKAYDPISKTINYNQLNDLASGAGMEDMSQDRSLTYFPKEAQTKSDLAGQAMILKAYGVGPYTPHWANQPITGNTQDNATAPTQTPQTPRDILSTRPSEAVKTSPSTRATPATDQLKAGQDADYAAMQQAGALLQQRENLSKPWSQADTDSVLGPVTANPSAGRDIAAETGVQQPSQELGQVTLPGGLGTPPPEGEGISPPQLQTPAQVPQPKSNAPQSFWDYLETMNPNVQGQNGQGQNGNQIAKALQFPDGTSQDVVNAEAWKLQQDGALPAKSAYTVNDVNAGLQTVADRYAKQVVPPYWATLPHFGQYGKLEPPDPQVIAKANAEYAAQIGGITQKLAEKYGPAFAEKWKMDMDTYKAQIDADKFKNDVAQTNAANSGANTFATKISEVGSTAGLKGKIDPTTFPDKNAMETFNKQATAYAALDVPKSAGDAIAFAKNYAVAEGTPATEGVMQLLIGLGAPPKDRAAIHLMMTEGGGLGGLSGAAIAGLGSYLANQLSPLTLGNLKSHMAFQNTWETHTGKGKMPAMKAPSRNAPSDKIGPGQGDQHWSAQPITNEPAIQDSLPVYSEKDAYDLPSGTRFRGTDGKAYTR